LGKRVYGKTGNLKRLTSLALRPGGTGDSGAQSTFFDKAAILRDDPGDFEEQIMAECNLCQAELGPGAAACIRCGRTFVY
jgi:hypothetical protein